MKFRKLTLEEEKVIVGKGTEVPFSGKYDNFFAPGTYHCKRCGQALFSSEAKFEAGCGWPSFDQHVANSVKRIPDPDGKRTEIVCTGCQAHLGHVFEGEAFTPKNTRHCVNSVSLVFKPKINDQ